MMSRGLHVLLCLSVMVTVAFPHALPTEEILVVTTGSGGDTSSNVTPSEAVEVTSEEPNAPIALTEMAVRSEISLRYASTAVVAHVHNPASRAQEYTFRVLLPETAFISGFVMTLEGKPYKAYVKEKEEAKNIYNQAVAQGIGAAHVAAKARDSNVFTVSVNVEPKSRAVFNLTYEELLSRRNGVYNHAVNLHPGALVPRLTVTVHIRETQGIAVLRVPEIRTGNEVDATNEDAQNKNAVIKRSNKNREATITFTPDLEEQKVLIQIYKDKSSGRNVNRYGYQSQEEVPQDGTLGQFVVQYDVDRSKTNEVLVNNGYFVHFFAPSELPPLSKHVVFVLDISGSMSGRKIEQLIEAMQTILGELNKGDVFNIVQFESSVQILDIASAYERPATYENNFYYRPASYDIPPLLPPVPATPDFIAKAKLLISRLRAGGGTNIGTALDTAIALIQKYGAATRNVSAAATTTTTTTTPAAQHSETGENTSDASVPEPEKKQDGAAVQNNDSEIKNDEKEPIIIFLTDGEPTEGERNPTKIISVVAEKNYGDHKASIYSLAFGEDADKSFLRKLSLKNVGFSRHIYEASDAALQLHDFYRQISSPLVANVKFVYPPDQVKDGSITKHKFRRFYAGSEAVVAGRLHEDATELAPHVYGICGVGLDEGSRKRYDVTTSVSVADKTESYLPLERLWAYLTIQQLLDEHQVTDLKDDDENNPAKKALKLALKYEFVTSLTSLVVVKPNATSAVDTESADKASSSFPTAFYDSAPPSGPSSFSHYSMMARPSYSNNAYPIALSGMAAPMLDMHAYEESDILAIDDYGVLRGDVSRIEDFDYHSLITGGNGFPFYSSGRNFIPGIHVKRISPKIRGYVVTTPVPPPSSTTSSPLESYHLEDFAWLAPLLNTTTDSITLNQNGTQVILKITKDINAPKAASGDTECPTATDASAGRCVYLSRCPKARDVTLHLYTSIYCVVGDGYAGVCCPTSEVKEIQ
ncbi:PREDICTED: inter-alpha-trypsin inhibitor heavy chain H1-like isoform X1 [Papilio xuthus]|uniref:Inter-alpha-trypsin inhibitor heavy chain H1-like isoform X1 n=1 Tax=Papilio xuthus TaxID=66420 RepID=A0AAJ7E8A9_PAPXU|nr:PREDICTED: inter-alpha-trypsin inhibitor heavy chain H1-like isoform X1 [Papilio xuthus]